MVVNGSHIRSDYYDDYCSNIYIIVIVCGVDHNGTSIRRIVFILHRHRNSAQTFGTGVEREQASGLTNRRRAACEQEHASAGEDFRGHVEHTVQDDDAFE